ncbi:MAG: hypothetical protein DHS20C18_52430 [Saprospiraceae bacterium]|nr:MAG: hypothetical protein DHS20C18_52430 [Saprospiraceae bacterium]
MRYFWILILLICSFSLNAQTSQSSPYELSWATDGPILGSSIGVITVSFIINGKIVVLAEEDVTAYDGSGIFGIDRWVIRNWSLKAQKVSDVLLYTSYVTPLAMLLGEPSRKDFGKTALFAVEGMMATMAITNMAKVLFKRNRPFVYNKDAPMELKLMRGARLSFFSGHTSSSAFMTFLTAQLYSDYYPESKAKPYIWGLAAVLPALTGYNRIRGGKHYLTDVVLGYIVGTTIGILLPRLHHVSE